MKKHSSILIRPRLSACLAWVRALTAGFYRLDALHHPTDLTLVRPFTLFQTARERMALATIHFLPQVHLTLQRIVNRISSYGPVTSISNSSLNRKQFVVTRSLTTHASTISNQTTNFNSDAPVNLQLRKEIVVRDGSFTTVYSSASDVGHGNSASMKLLDLTFPKRVRTEHESRIRHEDLTISRRTTMLWQRLTQQRNRIELARNDTRGLTKLRVSPASTVTMPPNAVAGGYHVTQPATQTSLPEFSRTLPEVNIDMLTDQVMRQLDRRIIAARERMGKI
jgi:hypothetical protein